MAEVSHHLGRADDLTLWRQMVAKVVRAGGRIADTGGGEGGGQGIDFIRFQMGAFSLSLERCATGMVLRGDAEAMAVVLLP
jgi:hypothetical protein